MYTVYGYEKDSDIYDEIGTYSFGLARTIARDLCLANAKCKETNQPYDWFLIKSKECSLSKYIIYKNKNDEIICEDY